MEFWLAIELLVIGLGVWYCVAWLVRKVGPRAEPTMRWGYLFGAIAVLLAGSEYTFAPVARFWTDHPMSGQVVVSVLFVAATVLVVEELVERRDRRRWGALTIVARQEVADAAQAVWSELVTPIVHAREGAGIASDYDFHELVNQATPTEVRDAVEELLAVDPDWTHHYWVKLPRDALSLMKLGDRSILVPTGLHAQVLISATRLEDIAAKWASLAPSDDDLADVLDEALHASRWARWAAGSMRDIRPRTSTGPGSLDVLVAVLESLAQIRDRREQLDSDFAWVEARVAATQRRKRTLPWLRETIPTEHAPGASSPGGDEQRADPPREAS